MIRNRLSIFAFLCVAISSATVHAYQPCITWRCDAAAIRVVCELASTLYFKLNGSWLHTEQKAHGHHIEQRRRCVRINEHDVDCEYINVHVSFSESETCFNPILLRVGGNLLSFGGKFDYDSDYVRSTHKINLRKPSGQPKRLWILSFDEPEIYIEETFTLTLRDINPELAKILDELRDAIDDIVSDGLDTLRSLQRAENYARLLSELEKELEQFFGKEISEIDEDDFEAVFTGELEIFKNQFRNLLRKLREGLEQQQESVDRTLADVDESLQPFSQGAFADEYSSEGADPFDEDLYSDVDADLPPVDATEPVEDETEEEKDVEDAWQRYANDVIAQLNACRDENGNGKVVERGEFLGIVRSWRTTVEEVRNAFDFQEDPWVHEVQAFARSVHAVSSHVGQFIDDAGWFLDSAVPTTIRDAIAMYVEPFDAQRAEGLRHAMHLWLDEQATPDQMMAMQMVPVLAAMYRTAAIGYLDRHAADLAADETTHWLFVVGHVGAGFTPVGDMLDLCELVSGKEACVPGGRDLSIYERVSAGLGVVIGNRHFWEYLGTGVGGAVMMVVSRKLSKIEKALSDLPPDVRQSIISRFSSEALDSLADIPGQKIVQLATDLGDEALERLAKQIPGKQINKLAEDLTPKNLLKLFSEIDGQQIHALNRSYKKDTVKWYCDFWPASEIKRFFFDAPDLSANFGALSRAVEFGIKPHNKLSKTLSGSGLHSHHIIEGRFAGTLKIKKIHMPAVAVTPDEHQEFTNAWRDAIPYVTGTATAKTEEIMEVARDIYKEYPEILRVLSM